MLDTGSRVLAGLAAVGALLAGCSTAAPHPPPPAGPASTGASAPTTSSVSPLPVRQDLAELAQVVHARIGQDRTAAITTDLDLAGNRSTGSGVIRFTDAGLPDLDVTTALPASPGAAAVQTRLVAIGTDTYANFARTGAGSGQWVRLSPAGSDLFTGLLDDLTSSLRQAADPRLFLTLAASGGQITAADRDKVDAADAVRYAIHVDVAKAERDPAAMPVARQLLANGVGQLDFQLWIGAADRPLRLASSENLSQFGPVTGHVDFTRWGEPVQISAPPVGR